MNNQAAQTIPELPHTNLLHMYGADFINVYTADQMHQYARDYAAALSQTAGVPVITIEMWDAGSAAYTKWITRTYQVGRPTDEQREEGKREAVAAMLAAAPAASGGEDGWSLAMRVREALDRASCPDHFMRIAVETITGDAPQPPSAASVSERAREAWEDFVGCYLGDNEGEASLQTSGLCRMAFDAGMRVSAYPSIEDAIVALVGALQRGKGWMHDYADAIVRDAIDRRGLVKQALTQQRGDGEAVDRDAWAEALELPQGYTVEEFLPGGWHYAWTRADGERMVSCTTWNHPALAAIAAWQYAPATTPQPGAEALRELVGRWYGRARHKESMKSHGDGIIAYDTCARELESLLGRGG